MCRSFAGSGGAVMTTGTGAGYPGMIKIHIGPTAGDVTVLAHITARKVGRPLARRRRAIMATGTGAGYSGMIKPGAGPSCGGMAGVTLVGTLNVFSVFTHGGNIVMATGTRPHHRTVFNPENGSPGLSRMTIGAEVVRPNMIRTFCS